jgi:hypothetical protein
MAVLAWALAGCSNGRPEAETAAPEFPSQDAERWLGGAPTTLAKLRGDVVLVEAWSRH